LWALGATILVSLISFIGIIGLLFKDKLLHKTLLLLVGFSAGTLIGGAFIHLIPQAAEEISLGQVSFYVLIGFSAFFLIERSLHWHHCHKHGKCPDTLLTHMSLIGDGVHNLIDGLIIGASFVISVPLGIITSLAIVAHETPQEISDLGVLLHGGFSKWEAIKANIMVATAAIVGAFIGVFLSSVTENFLQFIIPFAAGGFIYIAATDLIPELHKELEFKKSLFSFIFFLVGILFMYGLKVIFG